MYNFQGDKNMLVFLLWIGNGAASLGNMLFGKLISNRIRDNNNLNHTQLLFFNGACACVFFLFSGGFVIKATGFTLLYALAFAIVVLAAVLFNSYSYRVVKISDLTVIMNAGSLIVSTTLGVLLFDETLHFKDILRLGLMILAVFFVFFSSRQNEEKSAEKKSILVLFSVMSIAIALAVAEVLVLKYYALTPNVADANSLFFFTNAITVLVTLIFKICFPSRDNVGFGKIKPKTILLLSLNTVTSNVGSLINAELLSRVGVSVYTPLKTALAIISGAVASLVFKEQLRIFDLLAVIASIVAIVI